MQEPIYEVITATWKHAVPQYENVDFTVVRRLQPGETVEEVAPEVQEKVIAQAFAFEDRIAAAKKARRTMRPADDLPPMQAQPPAKPAPAQANGYRQANGSPATRPLDISGIYSANYAGRLAAPAPAQPTAPPTGNTPGPRIGYVMGERQNPASPMTVYRCTEDGCRTTLTKKQHDYTTERYGHSLCVRHEPMPGVSKPMPNPVATAAR